MRVLTRDTRAYYGAMVSENYVVLPKGTVYEVWDAVTNEGWYGIAIPVTDYLYITFWVKEENLQ